MAEGVGHGGAVALGVVGVGGGVTLTGVGAVLGEELAHPVVGVAPSARISTGPVGPGPLGQETSLVIGEGALKGLGGNGERQASGGVPGGDGGARLRGALGLGAGQFAAALVSGVGGQGAEGVGGGGEKAVGVVGKGADVGGVGRGDRREGGKKKPCETQGGEGHTEAPSGNAVKGACKAMKSGP